MGHGWSTNWLVLAGSWGIDCLMTRLLVGLVRFGLDWLVFWLGVGWYVPWFDGLV